MIENIDTNKFTFKDIIKAIHDLKQKTNYFPTKLFIARNILDSIVLEHLSQYHISFLSQGIKICGIEVVEIIKPDDLIICSI